MIFSTFSHQPRLMPTFQPTFMITLLIGSYHDCSIGDSNSSLSSDSFLLLPPKCLASSEFPDSSSLRVLVSHLLPFPWKVLSLGALISITFCQNPESHCQFHVQPVYLCELNAFLFLIYRILLTKNRDKFF